MELGKKVYYARKMKGWSQTDLAQMVGMTKASISSLESGRNNPSPKNAKKLSEALNIPMEYLVGNITDDPQAMAEIVEKTKKITPEVLTERLRKLGVSEEKINQALNLLLTT